MMYEAKDGNLVIVVHAQPADAENIMRALVGLMRNIDDSYKASTDLFYVGMLLDAMLPEERQVERMLETA